MSINTLTVDNPDKSWANLYVNSMTVYNDLEVRGNITNTGSVSGDVIHEDNVVIKGKLTLDGSNNPDNDALRIIGLKEIRTDGFIYTSSSIETEDAVYGKDGLFTGFVTIANLDGTTASFTGELSSVQPIYEREYTGSGAAPASGSYKVRFVEMGGLVCANLLSSDFEFIATSNATAIFTPNSFVSQSYVPTSNVDIVCFMKNNGIVSTGIIRINSSGTLTMGPSVTAGGIQPFASGTVCGPFGNTTMSYYSHKPV